MVVTGYCTNWLHLACVHLGFADFPKPGTRWRVSASDFEKAKCAVPSKHRWLSGNAHHLKNVEESMAKQPVGLCWLTFYDFLSPRGPLPDVLRLVIDGKRMLAVQLQQV